MLLFCMGTMATASDQPDRRTNFVLCMADDQGWGDVGYRGHPVLKTPTLDEMAQSGLLLERFYAAAPVCSPTRGSVLTGRHPNRFGCLAWGHSLRPEEVTIAEALQLSGYVTGHFGKWHVGSIHPDSPVSPASSGFDEWLTSPNFYENNPLMIHNGLVIQTEGEGSQVTVDATIEFMRDAVRRQVPFLAVVWFGSPHSPHVATDEDRQLYHDQPEKLQHFYGEITAMDRAVGRLRHELRRLKIAENTLFWYNSDNGALPIGSAGGLAGKKGSLDEGGIRVPAMIEWPARIASPRVSNIPCGTVDIYPTLLEIAAVNVTEQPWPLDGMSLLPLFDGGMNERKKPLGFWSYPEKGKPVYSTRILQQIAQQQEKDGVSEVPSSKTQPTKLQISGEKPIQYSETNLPGSSAWIDGNYKLRREAVADNTPTYTLFDLENDRREQKNLVDQQPERMQRMKVALHDWQVSVIRSLNGKDYSHP